MLPPFFSNLLPEGALREYLANKVNVHPEREFFLLSVLGKDLPGAVRVSSDDTGHGAQYMPLSTVEPEQISVLRFSLAGVQLKFSAILEPTGGLTIRADGSGGSWIVKLPSNVFPGVPEAEFSMLSFARRVGINVPDFRLVDTASIEGLPRDIPRGFGDSLAIKRFARRDDGSRIHMEDFAQVFGLYPKEKPQSVAPKECVRSCMLYLLSNASLAASASLANSSERS